MKKLTESQEESLKKILFMMNYDSSKTLTEQLQWGDQRIFAPSAAEQLGDYFGQLKSIFDFTEEYKEQLKRVPRQLDDNTINELSKKLFSTMQGLKMNKKPVADVFESLKSISDFIALNDTFNSYYGQRQDLYKWIVNEVSMGVKVQQRILTSLKNLLKQGASQLGIKPPESVTPETPAPESPVPNPPPAKTAQYPFAKGTDDDPYRKGTKGSGIAQVQQNMGLVQDGMWGPKTDAKIRELAPEFANGFTNQNLLQVIQKVRQSSGSTPIAAQPTSQVQTPQVAAPIQNPGLKMMNQVPQTQQPAQAQQPLSNRDQRLTNRAQRIAGKIGK